MKKVLLIDDDNTVLLGLGVRLKSMGYTVFTAKDAANAITASQKPGLRDQGMRLGAAAFLQKPLAATTLADAIESALSPGDSRQTLERAV